MKMKKINGLSLTPSGGTCEYIQTNEYFLFHLLSHMAYHFLNGGCGIRPFLDLLVLKDQLSCEEAKLLNLCREAGIQKFYVNTKDLMRVWFGGAAHTPVTRRMEAFLLNGGSFGTSEQHVAVQQNQHHSKYASVFHRIFATKDHLYGRYPYLEAHRWLLPYYQVKRWTTAFQRGRWEMVQKEWRESRDIDMHQKSQVEQMLEDNWLL